MRHLFDAFESFPGALLVFTDWALYRPDEMALMDSMRRGHGEDRWLIESPGHLFAPSEAPEAIGHCYLALMFGWSAYLYLGSGAVTILFWEGDLVDVWSPNDALAGAVREVVRGFELRVTSEPTA